MIHGMSMWGLLRDDMHITDKQVKPISDLNLLQRIRLLFDLEIDF